LAKPKRRIEYIKHPELEKKWKPMKPKNDQPNRLYLKDRLGERILVCERGKHSMSVFISDTYDPNIITDEMKQSLSTSIYE
jgi:hypothetical protein